jgi:hypothetical protein
MRLHRRQFYTLEHPDCRSGAFVAALAVDMREQGQRTPLVVRPGKAPGTYEVVDGRLRLTAVTGAPLLHLWALVVERVLNGLRIALCGERHHATIGLPLAVQVGIEMVAEGFAPSAFEELLWMGVADYAALRRLLGQGPAGWIKEMRRTHLSWPALRLLSRVADDGRPQALYTLPRREQVSVAALRRLVHEEPSLMDERVPSSEEARSCHAWRLDSGPLRVRCLAPQGPA